MLTKTLALGLLIAAAPAAAIAETYTVDPGHSVLIFKAQHFGAGYTYGRFRKLSGTVTTGKNASVSIEAEADSLYTGIKKRDLHLKGPDFLNTKQFPKIAFKSTRVTKRGKTYRVAGELTLHGVTKKVTVTMKQTGAGKMQGKALIGFEGTLKIKRSDFAMKSMIGPVSDAIYVTVAIEATK